jgi:hypothetical protein
VMTTTSYVSAKLLARTGKGVLALRLTAPTTSAGKREAVSKSALVWEGVTSMGIPSCTNEEGHEADAMQADYEHENCLRIRCMYCHAYVIVTIGNDQWLTPEPEWSMTGVDQSRPL